MGVGRSVVGERRRLDAERAHGLEREGAVFVTGLDRRWLGQLDSEPHQIIRQLRGQPGAGRLRYAAEHRGRLVTARRGLQVRDGYLTHSTKHAVYRILRSRLAAGGAHRLRRLRRPDIDPVLCLVRSTAVTHLDGGEAHDPGGRGGVLHRVVLKAGEERVARQSAGADALVLLREPGLQRGDHAGLARSRRPLHQRDVRCVQGDVEGDPLPIIGSRKHVAHRLRDRLQAAAMPFRDRLSLDDQAKLGNWIGTASDSLPGIGAPPDAHLVSAEAHEEIAAAWRLPVVLTRGRAKVEARRRRSPPCKLTGERPPRRSRRSCGVLTLNVRGNLLARLERLAVERVQLLRQVAVLSCPDIDAKAPDSVGKLPAIGVGHPSEPACPP